MPTEREHESSWETRGEGTRGGGERAFVQRILQDALGTLLAGQGDLLTLLLDEAAGRVRRDGAGVLS